MLNSLRLLIIFKSCILLKKGIGSKLRGGIHIRPTIFNFRSLQQKSINSLIDDWSIPFFCISLPIFTWIKYLIFFSDLFSRLDKILANFSLSRVWIKSNKSNASFALLDCNLPMRCNFTFELFYVLIRRFSNSFSSKSKLL